MDYKARLNNQEAPSTIVIEKTNQAYVDLYKTTPALQSYGWLKNELGVDKLSLLTPAPYNVAVPSLTAIKEELASQYDKRYSVPCPRMEDVEDELSAEAKEKFPSLFDIFKRKKFVDEKKDTQYKALYDAWSKQKEVAISKLVEENCTAIFEERMNAWSLAKREFDEAEAARIAPLNEALQEKVSAVNLRLENFLECNGRYLYEMVPQVLSSIALNFEVRITYMIDSANGLIALDVDLPEADEIPTCKVVTLASGYQSVQDKLVSECHRDYARCVSGLAFYLATHMFNISLSVKKVFVGGYTQMISPLTGNPEDLYVMEVMFDRATFTPITVKNCNPEEAITMFQHNMDLSLRSGLRPIKNGGSVKLALMQRDSVISGNIDIPATPISFVETPQFGAVDMKLLDPMFADVARYVVAKQDGSTSRLQRAFEIGYNRAGKLSDQLEAAGIVGPNKGPQGREVLIQDLDYLEKLLSMLGL